jgi:hypothetical protein
MSSQRGEGHIDQAVMDGTRSLGWRGSIKGRDEQSSCHGLESIIIEVCLFSSDNIIHYLRENGGKESISYLLKQSTSFLNHFLELSTFILKKGIAGNIIHLTTSAVIMRITTPGAVFVIEIVLGESPISLNS